MKDILQEALNKARIIITSGGVKSLNYTLPKADIYIDCRGVANPCYGMSGSGDDPKVQEWVEKNTTVHPYVEIILETLTRIPMRRRGQEEPFKEPVRIMCFCAHGIHRSRAMKHILSNRLKAAGVKEVTVE